MKNNISLGSLEWATQAVDEIAAEKQREVGRLFGQMFLGLIDAGIDRTEAMMILAGIFVGMASGSAKTGSDE